jgi:hypothetical protein
MGRLTSALVELNQIEAFMRRRYLYEHPIFGRITTAVGLIEAEIAATTPVTPPPPEPEPEIEPATEPEPTASEPEPEPETPAEGKPPARRARKRR